MRKRGSPISAATGLFFDIRKCIDCTIDEALDADEEEDEHEDDLSSASSRSRIEHDENRGNQQSQEDFPEEFKVQDNWPHASDIPNSDSEVINEEDVARVMACRCINMRGAIAHGKRPGLMYEAADVSHCSVSEIFSNFGDGFKILVSVTDIKTELMRRGPVVSTSFKLTSSLANSPNMSNNFLSSQVSKTHPLLITGWRVTEFGEVWIVSHLDLNAEDHIIAFGHFDIDSECLAPRGSFENTPWQEGPYFDHDFSRVSEDWRQWPNLKMHLKSNDLERLGACFDSGFVSAVASESHFELCDKNRRACSRTCSLKEIGWDSERSKWRVTA